MKIPRAKYWTSTNRAEAQGTGHLYLEQREVGSNCRLLRVVVVHDLGSQILDLDSQIFSFLTKNFH